MTTIIKITMFLKKKNEIEQLTKELETLKADIITDMNGKEEITCGQYKVTNKENNIVFYCYNRKKKIF